MSEFVSACLAYPFLQRAVAATLLASVLCAMVGTLAVVRRSTYVAGAVSSAAERPAVTQSSRTRSSPSTDACLRYVFMPVPPL